MIEIILFLNGGIGGVFAKQANKISEISVVACVTESPLLLASILGDIPIVAFGKGDDYSFLTHYQFDCIVSYNWNYRFPEEICEQYDCYNFHQALLPKHRGPIPLVFSILENDSETGVTMHRIRKGFDTGEIYGQIRIPLTNKATFLSLNKKCVVISISLLKRFAKEYPNIICSEQDDAEASYEGISDLKKYIISDKMSLEQFERVVRAFDGIIPLLYSIKGKVVKKIRASK